MFQEKRRQQHFINLIPSENFTSQAVLDALGSVMQSMLRRIMHLKTETKAKHRQINIQKVIQENVITEAMSTSMKQSDFVKREHLKPLDLIPVNGE